MATKSPEPELLTDDAEDEVAIESEELEDADGFDLDAGELLGPDVATTELRPFPPDTFGMAMPMSDSLVGGDPLNAYLAQLKHIAPLPAEEQQRLAERYHKDASVEAARRLVMSNLRLVVKIAREYHRRRVSLMELVQEGNVGLAEAIRRYDPYRGVKFTSYAQYWIRAMILNYLMNVMQLVKVGNTRSGRKLFYNLQKAREQLIQQGFLQPTMRQLADHLGVTETDVADVSRILDNPVMSLEAPAPGHETTSLGALIADEHSEAPDETFERLNLQEKIRAALTRFRGSLHDARELAIWDRRIVVDPEDAASLQELGDEFSVSRERIRQVEKTLKDRFKAEFTAAVGPDEIDLLFED